MGCSGCGKRRAEFRNLILEQQKKNNINNPTPSSLPSPPNLSNSPLQPVKPNVNSRAIARHLRAIARAERIRIRNERIKMRNERASQNKTAQ